MTKENKLLPFFTGLFVASLLVAVTVAGRLFSLGPFVFSAGVLVFPLAFVVGDVLTEVYGYREVRRVIWAGFLAELLLVVVYSITILLPAPEFFTASGAYAAVLSQAPRIVLASLCAYLMGEFANSYVLSRMKIAMQGKNMSWRFLGSTVVGQGVDSAVFYPVAFLGIYPLIQIFQLILAAWIFKVVWEAAALPISIWVTTKVKKIEQIDTYDRGINFNPFKLLE